VVENIAVFVIFWGHEWKSDAEHVQAASELRSMFQQLVSSSYECSLKEFELAAQPIGTGSYLGDEIIDSEPVAAGHELTDAQIRKMIMSEVNANLAPAPTADTFYAVVPPKGVPVNAGGETGCGGSNFIFCGYHDSFKDNAHRFRYTVLPFPCNAGGFTCFVDRTDSSAFALEAVASHEMAETISDPDAPPVGAGGWFEDSTGDENADICASNGCVTGFELGGSLFAVNPLWSNLSEGCVTSVACTPPPVACTDPSPGACIANGRTSRSCAFEWLVYPDLSFGNGGVPTPSVSCADGQPFCDVDGKSDGQCTFHVAACLNSDDPRLKCSPTSIGGVQLAASLASSTNPADQENKLTLLSALGDVDPASTGTVAGGAVTYNPAAATPNACSGYFDIIVPVQTKNGHTLPGSRTIRLTVATASGRINESLKLTCLPTFP
jgi:hypothetical protein